MIIPGVIASSRPPLAAPTKFGAKIVSIPTADQITVMGKLNMLYLRGTTVLSTYGGPGTENFIDTCFAAGLKMIMCLDWEAPGGAPKDFPANMTTYRNKIRSFLGDYANKIEVAVCENEPTTDAFYNDNQINAYLTELQVFAEECNNFGVKCTDGCVHIENVDLIRTGGSNHNTADVAAIIAACANIPLIYVNLHTQGSGSSYPAGLIKSTADYMRAQTGKPVMSNEWHLVNGDATTALVNDMVAQWREAGAIYSLIWGGDAGGGGEPINTGTTGTNLTSIGTAYKNAVAAT